MGVQAAKSLIKIACRVESGLLVFIIVLAPLTAQSTYSYAQDSPVPNHEIATNVDVFDLAWSPDGKLIALATSTGVKIFAGDLKEITELHGHHKNTVSVTWHPNGTLLASSGGASDSNIRIWERETSTNTFRSQKLIPTDYARVPLIRWSPDGTKLAALGIVDTDSYSELLGEIQIWNTQKWVLLATSAERYFSPILKLEWSRDSTQIVGVGDTFCHDELNCPYPGDGVYFLDANTGVMFNGIQTPPDGPSDLSWDGNSRMALSEIYLEIVDSTTLQLIHKFEHYYPAGLAWRPDGKALAEYEGEINLIDPSRDVMLKNFKPAIGTAFMVWSPGGTKLATGTREGTIQIWDVINLPNVENVPTLTPLPTIEFTPSPSPRPIQNP